METPQETPSTPEEATEAPQETGETAETTEARRKDLEARQVEAYRERVKEASDGLDELQETVTQREWLLITAKLDRPRQAIVEDGGLRLLALAWVKEKREHGGASWDRLLDMTDTDLVEVHGFPAEDPPPGYNPED